MRFRSLVAFPVVCGLVNFLGTLIGLMMAHGVIIILSAVLPAIGKAGMSGSVFYFEEWIILLASLLLGVFCALIPSLQAYRTDISKVLSGNS